MVVLKMIDWARLSFKKETLFSMGAHAPKPCVGYYTFSKNESKLGTGLGSGSVKQKVGGSFLFFLFISPSGIHHVFNERKNHIKLF